MRITYCEFRDVLAGFIGVTDLQVVLRQRHFCESLRSPGRRRCNREQHEIDSVTEMEIQLGIADQYGVDVPCSMFTEKLTMGDLYRVVMRHETTAAS